jgi:agmatinase
MTASDSSRRLALLGIPWDENSSFLKGAAEGPRFLRAAFACESSNRWAENGTEIRPELFWDAGDLAAARGEEMLGRIEAAVQELLERGLQPISLGGDHAVTYPILRAFSRRYPRLAILHFDAHPDLYDEFEGNRFSHACPFARIMEERLASRLVQLGVRAASGHQREQAARFGVEMIEMRSWRPDLTVRFETPVYISFDLDGIDPACAPGVSHPEPGGPTTRQVLDLIHRLDAPIVGADIVELNPSRDPSGITALVGAKLIKEIAARMLETEPQES